jgi:hypothetical protein
MSLPFVRVICRPFPSDDSHLAALIESFTRGDRIREPGHLEQQLREFYPLVVVRQRDELGELDPTIETWYVYRDGSPVAAHA